jgi:serine/threonine protein kinase
MTDRKKLARIVTRTATVGGEPRDNRPTLPIEDATAPPVAMLAADASFGRYRIKSTLGTGGMGAVYCAHDSKLERDVALKILHKSEGGAETRARALREARAVASLDHPNVVRVFDVGEIDGFTFVAMEFIPGLSLRALIQENRSSVADRVSWLISIASALDVAHQCGVVHRDVKPDNVLLSDDGVIKVVDFGIAHLEDSAKRTVTITRKGFAIGTPAYMAPEQLLGERVDARADQFAWGVLAFELITGRRPWDGADPIGLANQILRSPVPALSPGFVSTVIARTLEKRPQDRFESMAEVIHALADFQVRDESVPGRQAWWGHRLTLVGAALFALFTLTLARSTDRREGGSVAPSAIKVMTEDSAAREVFSTGMTEFREGSLAEASSHFEKACSLDMNFAAAHLWAAVVSHEPDTNMREHLQTAVKLRSVLSAEDRKILNAIEPWSNAPTDWTESERRLKTALEREPNNPLWPFILGWVRQRKKDHVGATKAFEQAISIDPWFGPPQVGNAEVALMAGDETAFERALQRCLDDVPSSTACIRLSAYRASARGDCEDAERATRKLIGLGPESSIWYRLLANIRFAISSDPAEARELLGLAAARLPQEARRTASIEFAADLAVLEGEFDVAERFVRDWEREVAASPEEWEHMRASRAGWYLALELGKKQEAAASAENYLRRHTSWSTNDLEISTGIFPIGVRYLSGAIGRSVFRAEREKWRAAEQSRARVRGEASNLPFVWFIAYAQTAKDAEDAREALAARGAYEPLYLPMERGVGLEEPYGRVYKLAGQSSHARASFEVAAASCEAVNFPFQQTWAMSELAETLEADGQYEAACRSYRRVILRWGRDARSVTGRHARQRWSYLHCDDRLTKEKESTR